MNLNIIDYIIENKKLNQAAIGKLLPVNEKVIAKLKKGEKQPTHISQAQISKWKQGIKIPKVRELELISIADLDDVCTEFNQFTLDNVDSRWAILTAEHCDGERWLDYLKDLVYKNQIISFEKNDVLEGNDLKDWSKELLYSLNNAGVYIHKAPEYDCLSHPDDLGAKFEKYPRSPFFEFIDTIFSEVLRRQKLAINIIPSGLKKNKNYLKLIGLITDGVIAMELEKISIKDIEDYLKKPFPLFSDPMKLFSFQLDIKFEIDKCITDLNQTSKNSKIDLVNNELFDKLSMFLGGSDWYEWNDEIHDQKIESIIDEKTIPNDSNKNYELEGNFDSKDHLRLLDEVDSDKYLSFAERKITDQLRKQEKDIEELHKKVDSLLNHLSSIKPST